MQGNSPAPGPAPPLPLLCIDCLAKPGYSLRLRKGDPHLPALEELQSQKRLRGTVRARLERRISCLASRHRWQMKTSGTLDLRILAQERWIQVAHSLHSIMGLPAKGFRQKQVIRSQASSSGQGERHWSETTLPAAARLASSTGDKWDSPHSPSALVLGAAVNSTAGITKGEKTKKERLDEQRALHPTSDTSRNRAALLFRPLQVPVVFPLLGEAWAIHKASLQPA